MQSFSESLNSPPFHYAIFKWDASYGFIYVADGVWKVSFENNDGHLDVGMSHESSGASLTGKHSAGTALRLYATIGELITKYVHDFPDNVKTIDFTASDPQMIAVYKRLAEKIAKQFKGHVTSPIQGTFYVRIK